MLDYLCVVEFHAIFGFARPALDNCTFPSSECSAPGCTPFFDRTHPIRRDVCPARERLRVSAHFRVWDVPAAEMAVVASAVADPSAVSKVVALEAASVALAWVAAASQRTDYPSLSTPVGWAERDHRALSYPNRFRASGLFHFSDKYRLRQLLRHL